ncbi:MAG TPA: hypothetical protein VN517_16170 [Terriglobales bacterium]|nr:hypothetical protein [Terriglobales bacterium]
MATVLNTYKVIYHFEVGGRKSGVEYSDYVQATASDYNSIRTVLSNNSKLKAGTLVIDSVNEVGHGDGAIA